jgi:hypothetical protein
MALQTGETMRTIFLNINPFSEKKRMAFMGLMESIILGDLTFIDCLILCDI